MAPAEYSDHYGTSQKIIPSTQYLRHKIPFKTKEEDGMATLGGGTRAGGLAGLGSLSHSELYDEYTMGHNHSNVNQILSHRLDQPDLVMMSQQSAAALDNNHLDNINRNDES